MARIIIIDDDEPIRNLLQQILEAEGHEAIVAENGKVGVQRHRESPADIIITDLIMPQQEGLETIIELKRDFPSLGIIAISGGGRLAPENYLSSAKRLGAAYTFTKPVPRKLLLEAIAALTAK
jgi:DNA-binding NtrC family response regulator